MKISSAVLIRTNNLLAEINKGKYLNILSKQVESCETKKAN